MTTGKQKHLTWKSISSEEVQFVRNDDDERV